MDDIICPIGLRIFFCPVIADDGKTYEFEEICKWFVNNNTSPHTGLVIEKNFRSDIKMIKAVREYIVDNPNSIINLYDNINIYRYIPKYPTVLNNISKRIKKTQKDYEDDIIYRYFIDICINSNLDIEYFCQYEIIKLNKIFIESWAESKKTFNFYFKETCPIHKACEKNNNEIVKILLDNDTDVNVKGKFFNDWYPINIACEHNNLEIVKMIIDKGGDANNYNPHKLYPIYVACKNNNFDMVKYFIECGVDINCKNEFKMSGRSNWLPIYVACENNNFDIVKLLVENGANLQDGKSVQIAFFNNNLKIIKYLVENKANVNCISPTEWQPLYIACEHNDYEMVNFLIDNGADINLPSYGWRPIDKACENNNFNIAKLLIEKGANLNLLNPHNKYPINIAYENNNYEIVNLLIKNGADMKIIT